MNNKDLANKIIDLPILELSELGKLEQALNYLDSVQNGSKWKKQCERLLNISSPKGRDVEAKLFELKVIFHLSSNFPKMKLTYEPKGIDSRGKNMDLLLENKGRKYLLELKKIKPETKKENEDENKCFQKDLKEWHEKEYFGNHSVGISQKYIWDEVFAAHGSLIRDTLDVEEKIDNYHQRDEDGKNITKMIGICAKSPIRLIDIKEFANIYYLGSRHPDGGWLKKMVEYGMNKNNKKFKKSINCFCGFPFEQRSFKFSEGNHPKIFIVEKDVLVVRDLTQLFD